MVKIFAISNQKGGVGKTTTACALISGLTSRKKKVLGIDLDPQGSLGFSFGVDIESGDSIYDVFCQKVKAEEAIRHTAHGDILISNILLSGAELEFSHSGREFMLRDAISDIKDKYDYIFIDTPPALNILTVNAYTAARQLIVPMVPDILSLLGISQLKDTITTVKKFYNSKLQVYGILLTRYNKRMNLTRDVEEMTEEIANQLGTVVLPPRIRNNVSVAEAPAHGESVLTYNPNCNAALDYRTLVDYIIDLEV
ncbi:MAG: ParA family protein [Oscillospiraceae bacterium]|nr:ParA family protein [Oscillospiraceae bacterium]